MQMVQINVIQNEHSNANGPDQPDTEWALSNANGPDQPDTEWAHSNANGPDQPDTEWAHSNANGPDAIWYMYNQHLERS